jgi:hypothetical protein
MGRNPNEPRFSDIGELPRALLLSVVPAKAGIHLSAALPRDRWIPAFAGMTGWAPMTILKARSDLRPHSSGESRYAVDQRNRVIARSAATKQSPSGGT